MHPANRYSMTRLGVALTVCLALVMPPAHADIVMSPYLQAVTQNGITVMVECNSTANATVEYGLTTSYGSSAVTSSSVATSGSSPATWVHRVKLTGLQANTLYHYRVKHGASTTGDFTFKTAVAPGTGYRFAFLADFRTGTSVHDAIASRVLNTDQPVMMLYGGDLCNDSGYTTFKNEFLRPNELALSARVPFFNVPGNHEGWGANTQAFTQAPSGTNGYYSFDYGDVHVLAINTQVDYSTTSAQYAFAQADLAASTKPWKIVISHYPAYCSGGHGEDSGMKTMSTNLFEPNKVDLVLVGHSHFYQHNLVNGLHHFVIGSVGAPLAAPGTASYTLKSAQDYCYGIMNVTPTTLGLTVYNDKGTVLDTLNLSKTLAAPTSLAATPVSSSQINLTWKDNAAGETRYRIERALYGGAFAFVANAGANATSFANTGLSANTVYRYRVRAENDSSSSAYSNEASAMTMDNGSGGTLDVRVASSSDDAEETVSSGAVNLTSTDLEMMVDASVQVVGIRFPNVTVPRGATISQAYIQFKTDESVNTNPCSITIAGEASDNAATFTTASKNISSRTRTGAAVSWNPPDWTVVGEVGANQRTPELKGVVQEIVNRSGWARGNYLAAIITGPSTSKRVAESYDLGAGGAAVLHIAYAGSLPSAPTALTASAASQTQINLSWTDNASNETGFKIERKTGSGGTYAQIATVGVNVKTYSNTGLTAGTTYYYRVRATNVTGDSAYSNEASATTTAPANQAPQIQSQPWADPNPVVLPNSTTLSVIATDDGLPVPPGQLVYTWSTVSGPGAVTFGANNGTATAHDCTARFAAAGEYVLRVTVSDGQLTDTGTVSVTASPGIGTGSGTILREVWTNVSGTGIAQIPLTTSPAIMDELNSFEAPTNWADNYGTRVRGYLHPPVSGAYTFWIASDDYGQLWLSSNEDPTGKTLIASVNGWTSSRQWTKYTSQQSAVVNLVAGRKYYIEALQKEGGGGDNLAVAWQGPGLAQTVIAGPYLSPFDPWLPGSGTIRREVWTNVGGTAVADIPLTAAPAVVDELTAFEAPTNWAENYGTRVRGYLHPPVSGDYTFWIASDDSSQLWLSSDDDPGKKTLMASVNGWTSSRQWTKYTSQQSATVNLTVGRKYYIEALQKEGGGGDNLAVAWQVPGQAQTVIAGAYLSPYNPTVGLPTPWQDQDVGAVGFAGNATYAGGLFSIDGGGADIWNSADEFHFVYRSLSGDGEITARVNQVENTNAWAKAGVMVRESLATGSRHATMVLTPGNGASFQYRATPDSSSASVTVGSISAPQWVRLVRSGTTLTGYRSSDGVSWTLASSTDIMLPTTVYIGLVVTSHDDSTTCTATMDQVTVTAP